jgi:hypothetical protein
MIAKNFFTGRLVVALMIPLLLGGCQTAGGLLLPKKKVPPYEDMEKAAPVEREGAAAPVPQAPAPAEERKDAQPAPGVPAWGGFEPPVLAGMSDYVSARITHYRDRQAQWEGLAESFSTRNLTLPQPEKWRDCTGALRTIVDGYLALHSTLNREYGFAGVVPPASPYAAFQQDIAYLESDCQAIFAAAAAVIPEQLQAYRQSIGGQAEEVVRYWAAQGDQQKVVESYENMIGAGGGKEISPETRELYGRALKATGKLEQAAEVLLDATQGKDAWQAWPLRLQAAELLFAEGKFPRARQEYEEVSGLFASLKQADAQVETQLALLAGQDEHGQELELYRQALKGSLQYDGATLPPELVASVQRLEELFPESNYARMGRALLDKAGGSAPQDAGQAMPPPQETEMQQMQQLQEKEAVDAKWQKALEMLDQRQFDQSILLFGELENSEYQAQARAKIAEAVNLAAAELRKEAANLFIKARKTDAVEPKKALLLESRRLLLLVQQRYPQADIIDKVKQNQKATEDQLRALDPNLLGE